MNKLLSILSKGQENALTARDIAKLLNYSDIRDVTFEIARLRQHGILICSSTDGTHKGYYLPESDDDVRKFVIKTESRISEITKALQPAIDYLEKKGGAEA